MGEGKKPDGRKSKECKLGRFTKSTGLNLIPRPPAKALPQKTLLFPSLGWEGECEIHFSALGGEGRITGSFFIKSLLPKQPFANFHPFIQAATSPQTGQGWGLSDSRVKPGKILEQSLVWPQPLPALGSAGTGSSTPGTFWGCWPRIPVAICSQPGRDTEEPFPASILQGMGWIHCFGASGFSFYLGLELKGTLQPQAPRDLNNSELEGANLE